MSLPHDQLLRLFTAIGAIALYGLMCLMIVRRERGKRRAAIQFSGAALSDTAPVWRIAYASQTGTAEEIARRAAETFRLAGVRVQLNTLSELSAAALAASERALFIVSTYGEGDPPDNAAAFAHILDQALSLDHLHYAVLALGDNGYTHFCGFGRQLNAWLGACGARPLFPPIEANRCDPDAIAAWHQQLSHLAGTDDAPDWQGPAFSFWQLTTRMHLNPGSQGNGMFHLEFEPAGAADLPHWESGDLVQIQVPTDSHPREYSVASIPHDGRIHLLVRLHYHPDGALGAASGWLTQSLNIGDRVPMRMRQHARFRLGDNAERPLILIGNGSGISGLRGHLKTRALAGSGPNWLLFGERSATSDYHYRAELENWRQTGVLARLDAVFSRDQPERYYVQDRLLETGNEVRTWVNSGAAIYVCGSLHGMAGGVDKTLATILGKNTLENLALDGRYRRDVY